MAKLFEQNNSLIHGGTPGEIGLIQVVSVTGTVQLEGSVNGGNDWTPIASFTEPKIQAVILAPAMRVTNGSGAAPVAEVYLEV